VRSNGVVYEESASLFSTVAWSSFSMSQNTQRSAGINLTGPDVTGGAPYHVKAFATLPTETSTTEAVQHSLFQLSAHVSAAVLDASAAGNTTRRTIPICFSRSDLNYDDIIYHPPFEILYPGAGFSEASVTFALTLSYFSTTAIVFRPRYVLAAQRLSIAPPQIITAVR